MESSISGNAVFIKDTNPIWTPFFSAMPATMTLAEAPISVPFPPKLNVLLTDAFFELYGIPQGLK